MILKMTGMRVVSVSNAREHWSASNRRNNAQCAELGFWVIVNGWSWENVSLPVDVTFYRIAPRMMDDDNLVSAFKHLRDCVASKLLPLTQANQHGRRGDDSDRRITWNYGQRQGRPKEYAVEIYFT